MAEGWRAAGRGGDFLPAAHKAPFPPNSDVTAEARTGWLVRALAGIHGSAAGKNLHADLLVTVQIGPGGRELHGHATRRLDHASGDFDQPTAPRAWLAFAERIVLAAAVLPLTPTAAGQRFGRHFFFGQFRQRTTTA